MMRRQTRFWQNEAKFSKDFNRAYEEISKDEGEEGAATASGDRRRFLRASRLSRVA
jgi:hypothetical protein